MCTKQERGILLDLLANLKATVTYRQEAPGYDPNDINRINEMEEYIRLTDHSLIDYDYFSSEIQKIEERYNAITTVSNLF